jgi:FkbM family methyltransferase
LRYANEVLGGAAIMDKRFGLKFKRLLAPWSNTLPSRALVKAIYGIFHIAKSCRNADYFYDEQERVWIGRAGDTFLALGHHLSRYFPHQLAPKIEYVLHVARDCWLFDYIPQAGDTVVDIGAGDGTDALIFSKLVGDTGRVIAVEAHPVTLRLLQATCKYNNLRNVEIVPQAIMGTAGTVAMTDSDLHFENRAEANAKNATGYIMPATTLDDLFDSLHLDRVALLKMNIEGAELDALGGMARAIGKVEHAGIACHDFLQSPGNTTIKRAVEAFMTEHDFLMRTRADDPRSYVRDHLHFTRRGLSAGLDRPGGQPC